MKTIIMIIVLLLVGCQADETVEQVEENIEPAYIKIDVDKAKEMMVEGNIILDVRTKAEYDEQHIENAILLPVDDIQNGEFDLLPDKDQIILVYCRSGNRSKIASEALIEAGYTKVYDFGGIIDWPYETVSE